MMETWGLILAAGRSQRFIDQMTGGPSPWQRARPAPLPKQLQPLAGRPLVFWSLQAFQRASSISGVILVLPEDQLASFQPTLQGLGLPKVQVICAGGASRAASVQVGLARLPREVELVAIHDGARPLVTPTLIDRVIEAAARTGAALPALPLRDTIKTPGEDGALHTLDRSALYGAQTPQVFEVALIRRAYAEARPGAAHATDDAQLVEAMGHPVELVEGEEANLKITTPQDLTQAAALIEDRHGPGAPPRIGTGYDVHALVPGRPLILGGVTVPHALGLAGHSDADVLCHSMGDALLGAAALGDLGSHFPDDDPRTTGISSLEILARIREMIRAAGYTVGNIDATVICQAPRLAPHVPALGQNIARALEVEVSRVSLKATTTEGLGPIGRGEGIAAQASVLLVHQTRTH